LKWEKIKVKKTKVKKFKVKKLKIKKNESQKNASVKPRPATNTLESNNPCIEWFTVVLNGHWRRKSRKKFQNLKLEKIKVKKV